MSDDHPETNPDSNDLATPEAESDSPASSPAGDASRGGETAATKFRQKLTSGQGSLDDYEEEEEMWSGGYSPKAMFGTWALMFLVTIAILVAAGMISQFTWTLAIGLIVLMWVVGLAWYASKRLGVHYQLTNQRFIHRVGLLTRKTDRIEVIDIDDVSYSQGPVQRMFGIGTIVITSSDRSHPVLTMVGIEKVQDVAGLVDDIRRKERRKRSVRIDSI